MTMTADPILHITSGDTRYAKAKVTLDGVVQANVVEAVTGRSGRLGRVVVTQKDSAGKIAHKTHYGVVVITLP